MAEAWKCNNNSGAGEAAAAKKKQADDLAAEQAETARVQTGIPMQYQQKAYQPIFGQAGTGQYKANADQMVNDIRQSYAPMAQNIIDQSKNTMRAGSQQAQNVAGRRGVGQGGVAQMGQNQALEAGVQNQQNMMANMGMQQQQAITGVQQQAAQMQQQQYQLDNQLAQADKQMQMQEWLTGRQIDSAEREARRQEILQQFNIDQTMRQSQLSEQMLPLDYLLKMYGANAGQQISSETGGSPGVFGTIGNLAGAASSIAGIAGLCLPKGTMVKLDDEGEIPVELIQVGDMVKGGHVLKVVKIERSPSHRFWLHKFDTGEVIMSNGHPYLDQLISKEEVNHDSEHTYDILTTNGYYCIGNVKLRSTLKE